MDKHTLDESAFHKHFVSGWKFKTLFLVVLLSILGYFLFTLWGGWDQVLDAVQKVGVTGIVAALALSLGNIALRFLRWQLFLKTLGQSLPWAKSLRIYLSGFSLTTTPGKTGEALRCLFLKDFDVPFRKSIGAFFAERVSDLAAVCVMASAGFWVYPKARPFLLLVAALLVFLLFAVNQDLWLKGVESWLKRNLPERFGNAAGFFIETVLSFRHCFSAKVLTLSLIIGIAAWSLEAVALHMLLKYLGINLSLLTAIFIYGFSLVIGGITLLPGGLGGAEVTMLQLLLLQGVAAPAAVAVTIVLRLTSLWFTVLLGLIALPKKFLYDRTSS